MLFDVLLHVGTLIAICAVYYKDIVRLFVEGICIVRDVLINFAALIKTFFYRSVTEEKIMLITVRTAEL